MTVLWGRARATSRFWTKLRNSQGQLGKYEGAKGLDLDEIRLIRVIIYARVIVVVVDIIECYRAFPAIPGKHTRTNTSTNEYHHNVLHCGSRHEISACTRINVPETQLDP